MEELPAPLPTSSPAAKAMESCGVSVIVPTFNRSKYIGECLDSLLAQTVPALEIIVIDDGSEDGTPDVLRSYGQRIRYIRKDNGGKPTAVNLGLSIAKGDLIWVFDDDDVALPNAISNRVAALQARPDAGFVYSPHYYGRDGPDGRIEQGRLHQLPIYDSDNFLFELMKGCFFHLATALVRADAYRTVGGFDAELLSSEDYDMQLRLARAFPAVFSPEPSFIFRQHTGLRGAKAIRYRGEQRVNVFRSFDQRVGLKLRSVVPLGDYLVPRNLLVTDQATQRAALLARVTVMASKGCLTEMMEDLRCVLTLLPANESLMHAEQRAISGAICTGYAGDAIKADWANFKIMLASLPDSPAGRTVARSIATGLFRLAKGYGGTLHRRGLRLKQAALIAISSI